MRIISFCAEGIRGAAERGFYDWALQQDADIICVQDLKARESDLREDVFWPRDYNTYVFDCMEKKQHNGVAIYCRQLPKAIMTGLGFSEFDFDARYIQADYERISFGSLLVPFAAPGDEEALAQKLRFFDLFHSHFNKVRNKRREYVICGNLNVAHKKRDVQRSAEHAGTPGFLPEERRILESLFTDLGYVDAFRQVISDDDVFTWWPSGQPGEDGWRVDYQIVSAGLRPIVEYGNVYTAKQFGNHAPLVMDYDYEI